jgi:hypothetical protein
MLLHFAVAVVGERHEPVAGAVLGVRELSAPAALTSQTVLDLYIYIHTYTYTQ